jgi:hypothetical protein
MHKPELYWIRNKYYTEKEVLVDKIGENKFRILEFGKFYPILSQGCLIDNCIAEVLQKYVPEQIELLKKVTIWRKATNEIWSNYSEIQIKNHLDLKEFESAKFDGFRIYHLMHNDIYVSSELKEKLLAEYGSASEIEFVNEWPKYAK